MQRGERRGELSRTHAGERRIHAAIRVLVRIASREFAVGAGTRLRLAAAGRAEVDCLRVIEGLRIAVRDVHARERTQLRVGAGCAIEARGATERAVRAGA